MLIFRTSEYATNFRRHDSPKLEAGAVRGNSAPTELYGGYRVTDIPTVTE